jgi:uncharacterized protein (DUF111 family)
MHGKIPVPAPATLELLEGHRVEFSGCKEELVTPTAAAIVAASFEPLPPDAGFTPESFGYGAGTRESKKGRLPNILRVALGRMDAAPAAVSIIRTTIDDMNPEFYSHTMELLFAQGALEVYYHPVMMKKNRPGVEVTVITETKDERRLADEILAQTSTLGVRICREQRVELERRKEKVKTDIGEATVKVAILPGGGERVSPEYESCRALAVAAGRSLIDVFEIVRSAWRSGRDE